MALFQRPDGEGEFVEARPRRARRDKSPPRVWRMRRNLDFHRQRYQVGLTVFEIASMNRVSEPTVRAGLRAAADHLAKEAAEARAEDDDG